MVGGGDGEGALPVREDGVFDVAVIGLGVMGSAAVSELARRGKRVVGLDQFEPGHARGSSHGESRAFRLAHFEGPHYCNLAREALAGWRRLEHATGETILTATGILECGPEDSENLAKSLQASTDNDLAHEILTSRGVAERFPAFRLPGDWRAVFQNDGGFLRPELAIRCFLDVARASGAELRFPTKVLGIEPRPASIVVATEAGPVEAERLIIAAGPWIADLVPPLGSLLTLTREVQLWFGAKPAGLFRPERFPVFALYDSEDLCYGFPDFNGSGVKAASHIPGRRLASADEARQDGDECDGVSARRVLARHIPVLDGPIVRTETCIYTNTPDGDFIIDRLPGDERIVIASPCSGHGFKYAPAIGEILADLALGGGTRHDIEAFRLSRFEMPKTL